MSKAVICDRCGLPIKEQSATHVETKWKFVTSHYDLCPLCVEELKKLMHLIDNKENENG